MVGLSRFVETKRVEFHNDHGAASDPSRAGDAADRLPSVAVDDSVSSSGKTACPLFKFPPGDGNASRKDSWRHPSGSLRAAERPIRPSSEMPLRIEKAFGPKMDTLLRMQTSYERAETRDRSASIKVKRYVPKTSSVQRRAAL